MSFLNGSRRIQRIHERQRSARRWTGAAREWIRAVCDRADRQSALRGRPDAARKLLLALVGMLLKLPRPRRGSYGEEVHRILHLEAQLLAPVEVVDHPRLEREGSLRAFLRAAQTLLREQVREHLPRSDRQAARYRM